MLKLKRVHHIAIICSDYRRSLNFYTKVLGMNLLAEHYRPEQQSYKTDLALGDHYVVELFSFPTPPPRPSHPEAAGLRHLAFAVDEGGEVIASVGGSTMLPQTVVLDRTGVVTYNQVGSVTYEALEELVAAAMAAD
jgi:glyoxylase I family protein